jgi:opacity protein-like surface antigen
MNNLLLTVFSISLATSALSAETYESSSYTGNYNTNLSFGDLNRISLEDEDGSSEGGWYIAPQVGVNFLSDRTYNGVNISYDSGLSFGVGVGLEFDNQFRLQLDIGYTKSDVDPVTFDGGLWWSSLSGVAVTHSGDISQLPIMITGIYDFGGDTVKPYIGIGLGTSRTRVHTINSAPGFTNGVSTDSSWDFSYQAVVGATIMLSPTSDLSVAYQFVKTNSDNWAGDFSNHRITVGLQYRF